MALTCELLSGDRTDVGVHCVMRVTAAGVPLVRSGLNCGKLDTVADFASYPDLLAKLRRGLRTSHASGLEIHLSLSRR